MIESISDCFGVDTSPAIPSRGSRALYLSSAVNRSMERNINKTRPPFVEIQVKFQTKEEEYTFRNGAISGMKFYQGELPLFSSFLIVSVGDLILAGYIRPNMIEFFTIYKGIDPAWMKAFWCQALNILTYNNDNDPGLYWTGDITTPMQNIFKSKYVKENTPMKISNVACYAHGRIFYASQSAIYASDWIYSQGLGLEQREAVLSNFESTYPSSGDGFGAPSEMGSITGILAIPQSDTLNGHGDVITACKNGFFSIAPNRKLRNDWTADPEMQKHILTGKGCAAHDSFATFANQILYRDSFGGVSSLRGDIASYQSGAEFQSVSTPVEEYEKYDYSSANIGFAQSVITRRRMLSTVCHLKEVSSHMGTHRYAMGMISSVLQKRDGKQSVSWEGLWTGPRVVAAVSTNIANNHKVIVASFDSDKQNRLYYLDEESLSYDMARGNPRNIQSKFSVSGLFFDKEANTEISTKKLDKIEGFFIQSNPNSVTGTYNVDGNKDHHEIGFQLTEISGCGKYSGRFLSDDICSITTQSGTQSKEGYIFKVNIFVEGNMQIAKLAFRGEQAEENGFAGKPQCSSVELKSNILCFDKNCKDYDNDFSYTF